MSESEAHCEAATKEACHETTGSQEAEQSPPVECHKPEEKTGASEPEESKECLSAAAGEEQAKPEHQKEQANKEGEPEKEEYLNKVAEEMVNEVFSDVAQTVVTEVGGSDNHHHHKTDEATGDSKDKEIQETKEDGEKKGEKEVCVITSKPEAANKHMESQTTTTATIETPEVSSTVNDDVPSSKPSRSSRRGSYASSRGYAPGYQNYGLTHLPYKSNFEPSEEARRRADEFFKTFKL